jgi:hypothetical protein
MKPNQILRYGGKSAIVVGVTNLLASLAYLLLPAAQKLGSRGADLLPSVAQNSTMLILLHLCFAVIGVFGIALVPALTAVVRTPVNEGWLSWAANLAIVGYAVFAVAGLLTIDHVPRVAQAYVAGDAATKAALLAVWRGSVDPFAFWGYGAVGLWIYLASAASFGAPQLKLSPVLVLLGIFVGVLHMLIPLGFVFKLPFLFAIINIVGTIVATVWYVWVGQSLRSAAKRGLVPDARGAAPGRRAADRG